MKKIALLFALISSVAPTAAFGRNPIIQTSFTADPAPLVHNGRVYLYTSHDHESASTFFEMRDWRVYSSADMVNWTDHGSALWVQTFSWARSDAWASQTIYRNGRFYWYVTLVNRDSSGRAIGVAVSDSPTGPFVDAIGEPLIAGSWYYIDPTVFIDDDGQAYLYWGNPGVWYVKLNEDMVSFDKSVGIVEVPLTHESFGVRHNDQRRATLYEEGPWLYERNGIYYLLYAAGGIPEHLAYSTGPSPIGPWTYRGTIMDVIRNGGAFTNHPGIVDFKGNTYLFYHNAALPGGGGFRRSVAVEQIEFNPDGSIPLIMPTREGIINSVGQLNPYTRVEAETIAWSEGVRADQNSQIGVFITRIHNGDHIRVREVDFGSEGPKYFRASVASASEGGAIEIRLGSPQGRLLGTFPVANTGGLQNWAVNTIDIENVTGIHDICFVFTGGEGELFNFDWWVFRK